MEKEFIVDVEVTLYCNQDCRHCINRISDKQYTLQDDSIDFNKLYVFLEKLISVKKNIKLILNGGEPTLHPDLLLFCEKINTLNNKSNNKINIWLFTNFSQDISYYKLILNKHLHLVFTYHSSLFTVNEFKTKLSQLPKDKCHIIFMLDSDISELINEFNDYQYEVRIFENKIYDKTLVEKFFNIKTYQYKNKNLKAICRLTDDYIYIDESGIIYKCMFNMTPVGLITDFKFNFLNKKLIMCDNNNCHYSYGKLIHGKN